MMRNLIKLGFVLLAFIALFTFAYGQEEEVSEKNVEIISPMDGSVVPTTFPVVIQANDIELDAGDTTAEAHPHLYIANSNMEIIDNANSMETDDHADDMEVIVASCDEIPDEAMDADDDDHAADDTDHTDADGHDHADDNHDHADESDEEMTDVDHEDVDNDHAADDTDHADADDHDHADDDHAADDTDHADADDHDHADDDHDHADESDKQIVIDRFDTPNCVMVTLEPGVYIIRLEIADNIHMTRTGEAFTDEIVVLVEE